MLNINTVSRKERHSKEESYIAKYRMPPVSARIQEHRKAIHGKLTKSTLVCVVNKLIGTNAELSLMQLTFGGGKSSNQSKWKLFH